MGGEESKRLRVLLDEAIHRSRRSRRAIERSLGWSQGYLGSLLRGRIELKVSHVFALARELEIEPLLLFLEVAPPRNPHWMLQQLGAGKPDAEPAAAEPVPATAAMNREQIEDLVRRTLRAELVRLGMVPREEPPPEA